MARAFPDAATSLYMAQQRRLSRLNRTMSARWRWMGSDFDVSWQLVSGLIAADVTQAQGGAAQDAIDAAALVIPASDMLATPSPAGFAGIASDGRDLTSLLYGAVVKAKSVDAESIAERLEAGRLWLVGAAETQVADATRLASSVSTAASSYYGYQRLVAPGCCKRCAALAGKEFRWNDGFQRHPRCRCIHVPLREKRSGYTNDIDPSQVRDLTKAQRRAIDDGADMTAVINADRGRSRNGMTTSEGTTKRGWHAYVQRAIDHEQGASTAYTTTGYRQQGFVKNYPVRRVSKQRLTPEAIYRLCGNDRDAAIRHLAANGYLVAGHSPSDVARIALGRT